MTATAGGVPEQSPTVFETGYNGAWVFGIIPSHYGVAQTFTVSSLRTLQSIELRVGGHGVEPASGLFEVSIYRFDTLLGQPGEKLAAVLANAQDYSGIDQGNAPISSFDMNRFDVLLDPAETYALSVTPTATYDGGPLTLQSAIDIYQGGNVFVLSVIPEASTITLFGLSLIFWFGVAWRRRHDIVVAGRAARDGQPAAAGWARRGELGANAP